MMTIPFCFLSYIDTLPLIIIYSEKSAFIVVSFQSSIV